MPSTGVAAVEAADGEADRKDRAERALPLPGCAASPDTRRNPQVRAQRADLAAVQLPVDEGGERRLVAAALLTRLDAGVARQERAASLGHAAVDLRVGPVELFGDLLVGPALHLQPQRADLLRLEALQRLGGARHVLERQEPLVRRRRVDGLERVAVELLGADDPLPRATHGHRLVLDDRVQPAHGASGVQASRVAQEDLEGALVGVARVVGAERVAPCGPQQRVGVLRDGGEDEVLGL